MLNLVQQDESLGKVVQAAKDVGDCEDAEQVVFVADQNMVDFAPVGFRVDVELGVDELGSAATPW